MKFLKRFIQIVTGLLLIFFSIGLFLPEFSYQSSITVNRSAEDAFTVFTDTSKAKDWLPGFKGFETIKGEPTQVGSQWYLIVEHEGKTMKMIETLKEFEANKLYRFDLDNEVMVADVTITFTEQGQQTHIDATTLVKGKGLLWKSLLPLAKSSMAEQDQLAYNKLKKLIENSNTK